MRIIKPASHQEWLELRRPRLTSTELASLHLTKSARCWHDLRDLKTTGESAFHGNKYTEWGLARESKLAPLLEAMDSRLIYNSIPCEDGTTAQALIINPDDDRLCGTPDLYSEDGEIIGEIKTARHTFTGGRYHDWTPDAYYLQCQANMLHTEADACILLVEYYDEEDGFFTCLGYDYQTIRRNPEVIQDMLKTAAEWFAWIDGAAPSWMGGITSLEDADSLIAAVEALAEAEHVAKEAAELIKSMKQLIEQLTGGSYAGEVAGYKLSVTKTKDQLRFDSAGFKKEHPDLHKHYQKRVKGYTQIRLTKEK